MGSKSKIAKDLCAIFPKADHFYDLFGGGFAMTHAMLLHRKSSYKYFHFNEIRKGMPELIKDAIAGKYSYENYQMPWVTREEFFSKKEYDLFIKIVWSFGNGGDSFLFGKEIEQQKRSLHNAIVFNEFDSYSKRIFGFDNFKDGIGIKDRRLFLKNRLKVLKAERCDMQWLQQLERLERLERVIFYNCDYRQVKIIPSSIVYCDIPYLGTEEYDKNKNFNHKEFYEWASSLEHPVFVSEYSLPDKRFTKVWSKEVKSSMAGGLSTRATEKLFCNQAALNKLNIRRKLKD